FIPLEIYGELLNQGIGVEIMDTAAACRTYNALTAESRKVVAALVLK
ncbi:MAG TPA: MTH938/NDUFAF3 family protein, partial [Gammaproteobacteria bacterium]|nr:MTH938/NDUFAF3 family protein [Gammaproteobacteria bacterium]